MAQNHVFDEKVAGNQHHGVVVDVEESDLIGFLPQHKEDCAQKIRYFKNKVGIGYPSIEPVLI